MDILLQDIRVALRSLRRRPGFVTAAVATLALGIAANTSMFTFLSATMFRPAPAGDPEQLTWLTETNRSGSFRNISYPAYLAFRAGVKEFTDVAAYDGVSLSLGGATPERIQGTLATANYFDALHVRVSLGRGFRPEEDAPGARAVAVISDAFWRQRFGANPRIIDSTIVLDGTFATVIGVAPAGFVGVNLETPTDVWVPMGMTAMARPTEPGILADDDLRWLTAIARLAPGVSAERAAAAATVISGSISHGPVDPTDPPDHVIANVTRIAGGLGPSDHVELMPVFLLLSIVPLLVLAVACANVGNLQLSRALGRRKELAMRRALGATRGRLVRQLLTESVVLAAGGCIVAIALSFWLTALMVRLSAVPAFIANAMHPDAGVLGATALLAMLSGVVFGLAPALSATRQDLTPALKNEMATVRVGKVRHRLRDSFVVAQIAISLVLLITAGLFLRSLGKAMNVDPGFDTRNAVAASFDLSLQGYSPERRAEFQTRVIERVEAIPGVTSAAISSALPFSGRNYATGTYAEGAAPEGRGLLTTYESVSPGYLSTMGIGLIAGRDLEAGDAASSPLVVVVSQTLAKRLWPNENAIGKRLRINNGTDPLREVVGVARDGRFTDLTEDPVPYFYAPEAQLPSRSYQMLVVRGVGEPAATIAAMTSAVKGIDPDLPLFNVQTMEAAMGFAVRLQRAVSAMLGVFGVLALVLAALGIFGVTAHGVTLRTREVGIRMSLGARTADVLAMFVREGLGLSAVGIGIGLLVSAAGSKVLASFLFGLQATDAVTFIGGAIVLAAMAALASYLPARRAARVDPMVALRQE